MQQKKLLAARILKTKRETFDFCSDGKVYFAKWHDNSIVTISSNWENHEPGYKARRRVKEGEKQVLQPHLVCSYNKEMSDVGLMDRLAESYRPSIGGKKWYWPLFINVVNLSVVAAWRLYRKTCQENLSHLQFCGQITLCLHKAGPEPERKFELAGILPEDVRYDNMDQTLGSTSQGRCKVCSKNTKNMCKKSNVRLHAESGKLCFEKYHSK